MVLIDKVYSFWLDLTGFVLLFGGLYFTIRTGFVQLRLFGESWHVVTENKRAGLAIDLAWGIADIAQCILAFINIPVCIIIGDAAYRALCDYQQQRKVGKNPEFSAEACGIKVKTDF